MTITTTKAAIELMRESDIDSVWQYKGHDDKIQYAAFVTGQYCDIYQFSWISALKHDGEITDMGQDFIDSNKSRTEAAVDYPVSPETKAYNTRRYEKLTHDLKELMRREND
jgi:hypothetical protein